MDLKNGAIKLKEILANPEAEKLAKQYFPSVMNNKLLLGMAKNWTLNQVLEKAGDRIDDKTKAKLRKELEAL